jgi:hypothetical protein
MVSVAQKTRALTSEPVLDCDAESRGGKQIRKQKK